MSINDSVNYNNSQINTYLNTIGSKIWDIKNTKADGIYMLV